MKKLFAVVAIMAMLTGCSTVSTVGSTLSEVGSNDLVVQYSTMKLIEQSDEIDSQDVLDTVEKARNVLVVNTEVSIDDFKSEMASRIDWNSLAPSDRLLIMAVVDEVQTNLEKKYEVEVLSDDVVIRIEHFLDLVEQAARLSA